MQIQSCGAAREVTGSCHKITVRGVSILLDCGMFQGTAVAEGKNGEPFPFDPKSIHAVLVTHAHLDHIGRLPLLVRGGFTGPIYCTPPTADIIPLELEDTLEIMSYEHRKFQAPLLYTADDIARTISRIERVDYNVVRDISPGITAVWRDAGHIFGSAFIEIHTPEGHLAFSGDIGNVNAPIIRDTEKLGPVSTLIVESTYGDRNHAPAEDRYVALRRVLTSALSRGGTVLLPAFSVERTQELMYELNRMAEDDHALRVPVYLDSPLSISISRIYKEYPAYYDKDARDRVSHGDDFLDFPNLHLCYTRDESKSINSVRGQKIIIAGSGMMNGGRIVHHALRYLSDPSSTLVLSGYQAVGTLGRSISDGASEVTIYRQRVPVRCRVVQMTEFSGHADRDTLLRWTKSAGTAPKNIFCVHGEERTALSFSETLKKTYPSAKVIVPEFGKVYEC